MPPPNWKTLTRIKSGSKPLIICSGCALALAALLLLLLLRKASPGLPLHPWSISLSPDGKWLATAGGQSSPTELPKVGELIFWDAHSGRKRRVLRQDSTVRTLAWSPDGNFVAIGDFAGNSRLVQPMSGKVLAVLPPHPGGTVGSVNSVAISTDSRLVAVGSTDGTITLWETAGKELDPLMLPPGEKVFSVAIAPEGGSIAAGGRNGKAYLFNLAQHAEPLILAAYEGPPPPREPRVEAVAFAPDGSMVAAACQQTLRIWRTGSGHFVRELNGATARVNSIAFSPEGQLLAGVDNNGTLLLWNPASGELINSTPAHRSQCFGVAFFRDGTRLATLGREDFTAKIWNAPGLVLEKTFFRATPAQLQKLKNE